MTDSKEREFLKKLQATFRVEAAEHLRAISSGLAQLAPGEDGSQSE